jgi:hypothetical protein
MGEGGGGRYKKYVQLHGCKYMFGMNKQAREMIIGADLLENTLTQTSCSASCNYLFMIFLSCMRPLIPVIALCMEGSTNYSFYINLTRQFWQAISTRNTNNMSEKLDFTCRQLVNDGKTAEVSVMMVDLLMFGVIS